MINKAEVGNRIAAIRNHLGYSQAKFSEMLGVSTQAVSKWETGLSLPDIEVLLNISWFAKTTMNSILDGNDFIGAGPGDDRGLEYMNGLLLCPTCKNRLTLQSEKLGKPFFECINGHRVDVIDGVVFFNTREIPGELWSLWLRNYDHYLEEQKNPGLPRYREGAVYYKDAIWEEIDRIRPSIIMDFACGTGSGIKQVIEKIRWPVTIILADVSHRILKYNRVFFTEEWKNPYVDMVCLACDCSDVPLPDNSIDMVFSNAGFESMQEKMMDGFREAHRVLKPGGHAVYSISIVDGHESENTQKWMKLLYSADDTFGKMLITHHMNDIQQWLAKCEGTGFGKNKDIKIYGEMTAPDGDVFPFENMVLRWMAQHVVVSEK